jgi:hypothetical protein
MKRHSKPGVFLALSLIGSAIPAAKTLMNQE